METKEQAYKQELEYQLKNSGELKEGYQFLHNIYDRGFFSKYFKGGFVIVVEFFIYVMFLICLVTSIAALVYHFKSAYSGVQELVGNNVETNVNLSVLIKIGFMLTFSLLWLVIGLFLSKIRAKNSIIDQMAEIIEGSIELENERIDRIKSVL